VKSEQSVLLEILIPPRKPGKHRIIQLEVVALMPETFKEKERSELEIVAQFVTDQPGAIEISPRIVSAVGKVVIYKMQERALADIDQGHIEAATKRLETVATKLLNLGEMDLARAVLLEAGRLSKTGTLSAAGKKYLKYGTRALSTDLEERSDDTLSSMRLRTSD
jgi:hypothetical protein